MALENRGEIARGLQLDAGLVLRRVDRGSLKRLDHAWAVRCHRWAREVAVCSAVLALGMVEVLELTVALVLYYCVGL